MYRLVRYIFYRVNLLKVNSILDENKNNSLYWEMIAWTRQWPTFVSGEYRTVCIIFLYRNTYTCCGYGFVHFSFTALRCKANGVWYVCYRLDCWTDDVYTYVLTINAIRIRRVHRWSSLLSAMLVSSDVKLLWTFFR